MEIPEEIADKLRAAGLDPSDPNVLIMLQQGMSQGRKKQKPTGLLPTEDCFVGRDQPTSEISSQHAEHFIKRSPLHGPFPGHLESIVFGMGCFWCSEALFFNLDGVFSTCVGYAGGVTKNPTYREVCSGQTNHNEVVRIVFDPAVVPLSKLLKVFWETHDPTQPNQQGNDRGTQYRSSIFFTTEQQERMAKASANTYAQAIIQSGCASAPLVSSSAASEENPGSAEEALWRSVIATEIVAAPEFFMGEDDHQQYDAKPGNREYCGLRPLGVGLPSGDWEAVA